jgi:polyphosphate kinase
MPYEEVEHVPIHLPERTHNTDYIRHPVPADMAVPDVY